MCTVYPGTASEGVLRCGCIQDGKFIDLIGEVQQLVPLVAAFTG